MLELLPPLDLAQAFGYLALGLVFLAFFFNQRPSILAIQGLSVVAMGIHLWLLGETVAAALCAVIIVRNLSFIVFKSRDTNWGICFALIAAYTIATVIYWQGPIDLLPYIGTALGTIAATLQKPAHMRWCFLVSATPWLIYGWLIQSYPLFIYESVMQGSVIINIIRLDILKHSS